MTLSEKNSVDRLKDSIVEDQSAMRKKIDGLFEFSEGTGANVVSFIKLINKGYTPIIYANHQSYVDAKIFRGIAKKVGQHVPSEELRGFYLPIAASLESGGQGTFADSVRDMFENIYNKESNLTMVPVVREADVKDHGMHDGTHRKELVRLLRAPDEKHGLALFPEGARTGGRTGEDGQINGMQAVSENGLLLHFLKKHAEQGTVLLPVGIDGTHSILPPDQDEIPQEVVDMVFGSKPARPVAKIAVGEPFIVDESNISDITMDGLMRKIAPLVSPAARGAYR